jgi:hypothetical protein
MIPIDPKTLEKIAKGGFALGAAAVAAIVGCFAGKKHSDQKEKIRREKLDKKELARHNKIEGDR